MVIEYAAERARPARSAPSSAGAAVRVSAHRRRGEAKTGREGEHKREEQQAEAEGAGVHRAMNDTADGAIEPASDRPPRAADASSLLLLRREEETQTSTASDQSSAQIDHSAGRICAFTGLKYSFCMDSKPGKTTRETAAITTALDSCFR
jgi:hypothetical protein